MNVKTILLLLLFFVQLFPITLVAQQSLLDKRITARYSKEPLRNVLIDLQQKHHIYFSYSSNRLVLDKEINQEFKEESLKGVLEKLFFETEIVYTLVEEDQIILTTSTNNLKGITQTVRGVVKDKTSKVTLPGATIRILGIGQEFGTITDKNGKFSVSKVPVGRIDIEVSFIGYDPLKLEQYVITSGKEVVVDLELKESLVALNEIVITSPNYSKHKPGNEMALTSSRSFTPEETSRYPGSFLDPARMAQAFAGVSIYDDLNNDIVIRGNSSKGLLWRIEGIEAPNPNHFFEEGSTGGAISMLSNNVLTSSDFYTSAFPAEFGNAISGVFDLKYRRGNDSKREYSLSTGVLGTEACVEGPFTKKSKASYLVNYRYSTLSMLRKLGVEIGSISEANFQDLSFNFFIPYKNSTLSLFGLGGSSRGGEKAETDTALSKYLYYKVNNDSKYRSGMAGVKFSHTFSQKTFFENIVSFSGYKTTSWIDTINLNGKQGLVDADSFINEAIRFSSTLTHKFSARSTMKSGLIVNRIWFDYTSHHQNKDGEIIKYLTGDGSAEFVQAFSQLKYDFREWVKVNAGIHFSYFHLSKDLSVEPRLGVQWKIDARHSLNGGWGIHSKSEPLITYFSLKKSDERSINEPNKSLKLTRAQHFVLGYDHAFNQNFRMKLETYYQYLYQVPSYSDSSMLVSTLNSLNGYTVYNTHVDTLKNNGTGRNYGIEITLEKFFSENYYFLLTGSLYESKFKIEDHVEYNTVFNSNFAFNILGGREFKLGKEGKNVLGVNSKLVWHGGKRYTPVDIERSIAKGEVQLILEKTNAYRAENYFRIDFTAYYKINRPHTTHSFYMDIQNITNRLNTSGYIYDKNVHENQKIFFNGIIPNVYYKVQF